MRAFYGTVVTNCCNGARAVAGLSFSSRYMQRCKPCSQTHLKACKMVFSLRVGSGVRVMELHPFFLVLARVTDGGKQRLREET